MRRAIAIWLGAALVLGGAVPGDAEAKRRKCTKKRAEVVASDRRVRILEVEPRYEPPRYFVCVRKTGRMREIVYNGESLGRFILRYPYLVYVQVDWGSGSVFETLYRYNVRTRSEFEVTSGGTYQDGGGSDLESILLHRSGRLAWTRSTYELGRASRSVETIGDWDEPRELDPGPDVEQGSLAMTRSGRRVYWMNAGEPRTAVLR